MRHAQSDPSCVRRQGRFQRSAAFTVIELLVLIGVLSVLLAILLPAVSNVRVQGQRTNEQHHARQLMIAFVAYANDNEDRVLPGHAPSNFRVFDQQGQLLKGAMLQEAKRRYPLRLAPYLDFDVRALMLDEVREQMDRFPRGEETEMMYQYAVSFAPSLGMNIQWIGGSTASDPHMPPGLLSPGHPDFSAWNQLYDMNRYYVTRTSQVRHTDRLIVFASARGTMPMYGGAGDDGDENGNGGGSGLIEIPAEGSYQILSPFTTEMFPESRWSEQFDPADEPRNFGYLSFRYHREAVTAFFDGSVGTLNQYQIRDMRHWANWATRDDWVLPLRQQ